MQKTLVWGLFTRTLHWAIAIPVAINFFIDGGDLPHKVLGYFALIALVIRFCWGFRAPDYANFEKFPLSLLHVKTFLLSLKNKNSVDYSGHNPLSSWVYIMIWILVIGLGITGFMMGLDAFWGEDWLEEFHELLSSALASLVVLHLVGIIFDGIRHKRKTWLGMITGKRH